MYIQVYTIYTSIYYIYMKEQLSAMAKSVQQEHLPSIDRTFSAVAVDDKPLLATSYYIQKFNIK